MTFFKLENILLILILALALWLRIFNLSTNPPGLYWDEAAIGYDAYSILKTGADQHGRFLPLFFESFGDWKLPGYEYLAVPFIAIFGLSEFSVRLPNVILGTLTILLLYLLVKSQTKNYKLALCASLLLAISPWHIQFSRAAFESTAALFVFLLGLCLLFKSISAKNVKLLVFSIFIIALTQYIYHSYRIFAPLFLIGFGFIYRDFFIKFKKASVIVLVVFLVVSLPIISFSFTKEGTMRASSQSTFNKVDFEKARLEFDQRSKPPFRFLSKYLFNQPLYISQLLLKNYLDHFAPSFLSFKGDQVGRQSQVDIGQINIFELPLIILGLFLIRSLKNRKFALTILLWLVLAPIPAAIVTPTPHANRDLQMVIPIVFLGGLGLNYVFKKAPKIFVIFWVLWMLGVLVIYINQLFVIYPKKFAADWQYGNREMVNYVKNIAQNYQKVFITNALGMPYIYFLFYTQYDPSNYQKSGSTQGFSNYQFIERNTKFSGQTNSLYVAPAWQKTNGNLKRAFYDKQGQPIYKVWELIGND